MKHRTLWPVNQMSGVYMSSPVQNAWFAVIEQLAMVVGILGDIVANGTRYQKSVTAKKDETPPRSTSRLPRYGPVQDAIPRPLIARAEVCGEAKEDYHRKKGAIDTRKHFQSQQPQHFTSAHHGPPRSLRPARAQVRNAAPGVKDPHLAAALVRHSWNHPAIRSPRPSGSPARDQEEWQESISTLHSRQSQLRGRQTTMGILQRPPLGAGQAACDLGG